MSVPLLSGRPLPPKSEKEKARIQQRQDAADAIPPELLLRRDSAIRYEQNGDVYATDGKIGVLKKVVVDESAAEVVELIIQVHGDDRLVLLPPDIVDKSSGSALFLTINRVQFAERAAAGPQYVKGHFAKADLKSLLKRERKPGGAHPKRAVATAGVDFIETPATSPLDRLPKTQSAAAAD